MTPKFHKRDVTHSGRDGTTHVHTQYKHIQEGMGDNEGRGINAVSEEEDMFWVGGSHHESEQEDSELQSKADSNSVEGDEGVNAD